MNSNGKKNVMAWTLLVCFNICLTGIFIYYGNQMKNRFDKLDGFKDRQEQTNQVIESHISYQHDRARTVLYIKSFIEKTWIERKNIKLCNNENGCNHFLSNEIAKQIVETSEIFPWLDAFTYTGMLYQESRFDTSVVSPRGAMGIAQVMPYHAVILKRLGRIYDDSQLKMLKNNISASAYVLSMFQEACKGNLTCTIAGYNGGNAAVDYYVYGNGDLPSETKKYVSEINKITLAMNKEFKLYRLPEAND
jgi:hypothetical protein